MQTQRVRAPLDLFNFFFHMKGFLAFTYIQDEGTRQERYGILVSNLKGAERESGRESNKAECSII